MQIQASTCVASVHHSHVKEVMLTPTHLAMVLDYEAGGSAAEFVAHQVRPAVVYSGGGGGRQQ